MNDLTLIIGAGPTGLGAAWALQKAGKPFLILEGTKYLGGAAASVTDKAGFTWDYGGHVIHSHFEDFNQAIAEADVPMNLVPRNGAVWVRGRFFPTPYQQQVEAMPKDIMPGMPAGNLREYFQIEMGQRLSEEFFFPFNQKMWAYPLEELDHSWTSMRAGSGQANVPKVRLRSAVAPPVEYFPYPVLGTGDLWLRIAEMLPEESIVRNAEVKHIDLNEHMVYIDGTAYQYDRLISTMPLDRLLARCDDPSLMAPVSDLKHTEEGVLGFGFRGTPPEALRGKTYIYSPELDVNWHRASVLSNYSPTNAPTGHWSILFEASIGDHRPMGFNEMRKSCLETLAKWGVDVRSKVTEWSHFLPYGYPLPTIGRDVILGEIHKVLEEYDVQSRGRFGGWRYESCNQDYSFAQGVQAARGEEPTVLWAPEMFRG